MCKTVEALSLLLVEQKVNPSMTLRAVETLLREAITENQPKLMRLSHECLLELLRYDPETGHFYWRHGPRRGLRAGNINKVSGYRLITIDGLKYRASRLALFYVSGDWPENDVDHINQIKDDDSIKNLRDVTAYANQRNVNRPNPWGMPGVTQLASGKFRVCFNIDGEKKHIGVYDDQYDAVKACRAARKAHGVELG